MKNKVVVVTGATGALGSVVAEATLGRGARLATLSHSRGRLPEGSLHLALDGIDLSNPEQASTAIKAVEARFGQIDVLINIAGAFAFEPVADGDTETWQRLYRTNVLTALNAARAAIPCLRQSSAGRIINIGAMAALQASAGMGPYAASKAALHRLTEALAAELKGHITVNAVLPSTINTPANRTAMPDADFNKWVTPADLAEVILFLASDAAAAITGALLPVAGRA